MNSARFARVLSLFSLVFLFACAPKKEIKRQTDIIRRPDALIDASETNQLNYKTASIKASISISGEKEKTSFKAVIRMKKDSLIWSTITFFGIAGAKVFITPDSLKLINYKDRNYISESYESVQDFLKTNLLNIKNLQSVFLGGLPELEEFDKLKLKLEGDKYHLTTLSERRLENDWLEKKLEKLERKVEKQEEQNDDKGKVRKEKKQLKAEDKYENMALEVWVDPLSLNVERMTVKDYDYDAELSIEYSNFEEVQNVGLIPHKVSIELKDKKNLNIDITYSKIQFDTEVAMPFAIPNTYKRVKM